MPGSVPRASLFHFCYTLPRRHVLVRQVSESCCADLLALEPLRHVSRQSHAATVNMSDALEALVMENPVRATFHTGSTTRAWCGSGTEHYLDPKTM